MVHQLDSPERLGGTKVLPNIRADKIFLASIPVSLLHSSGSAD